MIGYPEFVDSLYREIPGLGQVPFDREKNPDLDLAEYKGRQVCLLGLHLKFQRYLAEVTGGKRKHYASMIQTIIGWITHTNMSWTNAKSFKPPHGGYPGQVKVNALVESIRETTH